MFKLTVECGPTPANANAAQISDEDYRQRSKAECKAWMAQPVRFMGEPPEGARLIILPSQHDYGTYYEVAPRARRNWWPPARPIPTCCGASRPPRCVPASRGCTRWPPCTGAAYAST